MTDRTNHTIDIKLEVMYHVYGLAVGVFALTVTHYKDGGDGHVHFECEYLGNGGKWDKRQCRQKSLRCRSTTRLINVFSFEHQRPEGEISSRLWRNGQCVAASASS